MADRPQTTPTRAQMIAYIRANPAAALDALYAADAEIEQMRAKNAPVLARADAALASIEKVLPNG